MGWLRLVGCLKIYVSLQNIGLFCRSLLQKRPIFLSILLIEATPYENRSRTKIWHQPYPNTKSRTNALANKFTRPPVRRGVGKEIFYQKRHRTKVYYPLHRTQCAHSRTYALSRMKPTPPPRHIGFCKEK